MIQTTYQGFKTCVSSLLILGIFSNFLSSCKVKNVKTTLRIISTEKIIISVRIVGPKGGSESKSKYHGTKRWKIFKFHKQ